MASNAILEKKKERVKEITSKFDSAVSMVIVDYKGITVEEDTKLRKELREANVEYIVVKNSILKFAVDNTSLEDLKQHFEGTTAIGFSYDDAVIPAKILSKFADDSKEKFNIKAGVIDGQILCAEDIIAVGKLPSKEVLIGKVLGSLNAPITGFVNVLSANIRGLVMVLDQISKKI